MQDISVIARKVEIVESKISHDEGVSFLYDPSAGGIAVFIGTTRQWTDDKETSLLAYDCYIPMALKEMERLADIAIEHWPILRVCLIHRIGVVPIAEASVLVGVSTPHRADAFEAARFLIDKLKEQVPIWKKEHYSDGSKEWVEGKAGNAINGV